MRKISVVIPVWNEEQNIASLVKRVHDSLSKEKITYEIVFIDDHSTDDTKKILKTLAKKYNISIFDKEGKKGKSFSLIEGFEKAQNDIVAMIDADLQYPPEALPKMLEKIEKGEADIVVANRVKVNTSKIRKFISRSFRFIFGKVLFGLENDIQAGLKVLRKELIYEANINPSSSWTLDLELLHKAKNLGYVIQNYDIFFEKRKNGKSKVSLVKASLEIGLNALSVRLKPLTPTHLRPSSRQSMLGAGIKHSGRTFVTHTTLHYSQSALQTFIFKQKIFIFIAIIATLTGLILNPILTLQIIIGILSFIYFIDVCFNFYLIIKSLHQPQEITTSEEELAQINESKLPIYSILCPLYKEAHIIPQFLESIDKLDYPKNKLDVMLLLEEDDQTSIDTVKQMPLPSYVRMLVVPNSQPKTKPKACNYGLAYAKGEYLVIYDAEDIPDSMQLKKAYLAFKKVDSKVFCLQAKLNYYNPHQNLLTRFFTAEYSLWFDITLTGLQSINTSIPLGGTSNHFKTINLKKLEGWDPFNVTEDADLGIRLFKQGYKTAIIDSVTLEEANSKWGNWLRQRSRWIKGYMQTYLVHTRNNLRFAKETGWHSLIFQLVVGGKIAFILINPFLWITTIAYFSLNAIVGPTIESLYPPFVFYMAAFSLVVGNFLFLYYFMIGAAKREQWSLIKYIFLTPFYWLMISIAGCIALYQLLFKPHYWEKTIHGFYKNKKKDDDLVARAVVETSAIENISFPKKVWKQFTSKILEKYFGQGFILIISTIISNIVNYFYIAYLGRTISFQDLALVGLINSFYYITSIPFGALFSTVSYKGAFIEGKYGKNSASTFFTHAKKQAKIFTIIFVGIWIIFSPFMASFFNLSNILPILLFTFVWIGGSAYFINRGFIFGTFGFISLSLIYIFEPIIKFILSIILVHYNLAYFTYGSIPISFFLGFLLSEFLVRKNKKLTKVDLGNDSKFPYKFFFISTLSGLSTLTFLSFDVMLANHYLSPINAGKYALVSTIGKTIYLVGGLVAQFLGAYVSRTEGEGKNSKRVFYDFLLLTGSLTILAFILIGLLGHITLPILFGSKVLAILPFIPVFCFAIACFTIATLFSYYHLNKRIYLTPIISFLIGIVQILLIIKFHQTIGNIVDVMALVGIINVSIMIILHIFESRVKILESNISDFFGLFLTQKFKSSGKKNLNILIFNWRDTKHKWAGGAEAYLQEIAKRWVKAGNSVTIFCGNSVNRPKNDTIDGVKIIRRGGFYTVYVWAILYYIFKFRHKFDVIIDSENGIPFFTPLYSRVSKFLLIHHVHQEIHRSQLKFPLSQIALFLEGKLMPFVYRNQIVITVSQSSKKELEQIGVNKDNIHIVHPGVTTTLLKKSKKTAYPSIVYLGRLKAYKNVDIALKAFAQILKEYPNAKFTIAGTGEMGGILQYLTGKLGIKDNVEFLGAVTEEQKAEVLAKSWVSIQPSMIEGWGITVIEANASGTPVIASNVNGLRDSIVHNRTGVLVRVKNIQEFSDAIKKCFSDKKFLKTLSEEAYLWSNNFSWDISADIFYKTILNELNKNVENINFYTKEKDK